MKLGIIVTEFPKVTETFILRDLMAFRRRGHELRIYHLRRFRRGEVVHDFARPTLGWARGLPYLLGRDVLGALARAAWRRPGELLRILIRIAWDLRFHPVLLAKSLAIVPKSLAAAEDLLTWGGDHVHAEFAGYPATSAWIIGRVTGLPYSVSCRAHDIFITQALLGPKLGEAAFVRTISEFNRNFLRERVPGLRDRAIEVIHSSVDASAVPAAPPGAPNAGFRVLYVGSLHTRKGVHDLLAALDRASPELGDWRCEIAGGGPDRARLERLAREHGIDGRVSFLGPQPFERISQAYASASVVVVPSTTGPGGRTEGIPNVLMEALAHLRPVVATRISGIPELVVDGETGLLVEPDDPAGLAEALVRVRRSPEDARRWAEAGRAAVERDFSLSRNADAQLAKFAEFCAARRPEPEDGSRMRNSRASRAIALPKQSR